MTKAALAFGANVGNRLGNIKKALRILQSNGINIIKKSDVFETQPFGIENQPRFLNACAIIETSLEPLELLELVKKIEMEIGRITRERWGPREIDIDILFMGNIHIQSDKLTIPHKGIQERSFVLEPLCQISPEWIHPVLDQSAESLMQKLDSKDNSVLKIAGL